MALPAHYSIPVDSGRKIADRFEVLRCLGVGSLGAVYLARDISSPNRLVALKTIIPFSDKHQDLAVVNARFRNEVESCKSVSHPNVVTILDLIETEDTLMYSMEYIAGGDLRQLLSQESTIKLSQVLQIIKEICLGLQAIHERGIIHRDLKPENILLTELLQVRIADFGVAQKEGGPCFTSPGGVVGTIDYQSPEYLDQNIISQQGDIYSLGVIAYQLVTGRLPFQAESVYRSIERKMTEAPISPHCLNASCSREFSDWILRALERSPAKRFSTALQMLQELEPIVVKYPLRRIPKEVQVVNDRVLRLIALNKEQQELKAKRRKIFYRIKKALTRSVKATKKTASR